MPQQGVKAIVKRYFEETNSQTEKWTCSCGKTLFQKKNTVWSNLFAHIKRQHKDYLQQGERVTLQVDNFVITNSKSVTKKAQLWLAGMGYLWIETFQFR